MFAASLAASVPEFMAKPTSAAAKAGASLVPSPIIATILFSACSRLAILYLSSGLACATYSSIPTSSAMLFAVSGWSPVIMTGRMPMTLSACIFSLMPSLRTSFNLIIPITESFLRWRWVFVRLRRCRLRRSRSLLGQKSAFALMDSGAPFIITISGSSIAASISSADVEVFLLIRSPFTFSFASFGQA